MKNRMHYYIIAVVATVILSAMGFSFYSSSVIINRNAPLVDAVMEAKLEATTAHLWFEELIAGDAYESYDNIMAHIDQSIWYINAMLKGGQNEEGVFSPIQDGYLLQETALAGEKLLMLKIATVNRYKESENSGIGSDRDQEYDKLFKSFIQQIDRVETLIQKKIKSDYNHYKTIQKFLIAACILLTGLAFFLQYSVNLDQKKHVEQLNEAKVRAEESENWLKTTMNSMGDGVIITDHNANVTYLNPVASYLTGWLLKEARGKKVTEVFQIYNEYTKEPVEDPVAIVIRKNLVVGLANHTELRSKNGKVWPISDSAAPIMDHDKNLQGVVVVFHEITKQKKAEKEKAQLEAQLRQTYKMEAIGTMAGGIAHDFNNILAMIIGNADIAMDHLPPGTQSRHNVREIIKAGNRAKNLIKQILSFSRQEEEQTGKKAHNLPKLITESMASLGSAFPASVRIQMDLPPEEIAADLNILSNATQIHQLLMNLCVNASQAMEEKGNLSIQLKPFSIEERLLTDQIQLDPGNYAHLCISDTGPGIAKGSESKIFDPFFTTKGPGQGTGMGLSVVHNIVKACEGKIYAQNLPEKGAAFHIYLPLTDQKPEEEKIDEDVSLEGDEHVLLVDDEEMIVELVEDVLTSHGYRVTATTDSTKALELFKAAPKDFDIVVTDQTMPALTGIELAQELSVIRKDIPILLCTGYSSKLGEDEAARTYVKEIIAKPYRNETLLAHIRKQFARG